MGVGDSRPFREWGKCTSDNKKKTSFVCPLVAEVNGKIGGHGRHGERNNYNWRGESVSASGGPKQASGC